MYGRSEDGHPGKTNHPAISNLTVRLLNEYTGRGPTKARTYVQDDLIVVMLWDTLTKAERSLVEDGHGVHVNTSRKLFQQALRPALVAGIEEITGRRIVAFLGDNHFDPDIAAVVFLMEPEPGERGYVEDRAVT